MALESATYVNGLVITNPTGSDSISQGDDHIRLIKKVLKNSLPNVTTATQPIVKVQLFQDSTGTTVNSTSMMDVLTMAYTKVSATSDLIFQASVFGTMDNNSTSASGRIQIYDNDNAARIGNFDYDVSGGWEFAGGADMEIDGISTWFAEETTPLSVGSKTFKIKALMDQALPAAGVLTVDDITVLIWEVER
jgi:hypothetical protein